jgi:hypothetical protein
MARQARNGTIWWGEIWLGQAWNDLALDKQKCVLYIVFKRATALERPRAIEVFLLE